MTLTRPAVWLVAGVLSVSGPAAWAQSPRLFEHNGSVVEMQLDGRLATIRYKVPRAGLAVNGVAAGTVLFHGTIEGGRVSGTAYLFRLGCPPVPYRVAGSDDGRALILRGAAPVRAAQGCAIDGESSTSANAELVFKSLSDPGMRG